MIEPTDFEGLLRALWEARVDFIVVGGVAATAHGSARLTVDLDVVYDRSPENMERLVLALRPLDPYLRGAPEGLPFRWDVETLRRGLNFTLTTRLGSLDILGEVTGGGDFHALREHTLEVDFFGIRCFVLTLDKLIEVKRAAGRPKDFEAIAELETIRELTS